MIPLSKSFTIALMGVLYWGCLNFWYYQWFYGKHDPINKGYFYLGVSVFLLFIFYQTYLNKRKSWLSDQLLIICFFSNILNFMILSISYFGIFDSVRNYFFLLNGSIFVLTFMILISGGRHGFFKN